MRTVAVPLPARAYSVHIGRGLLGDAARFGAALGTGMVLVVSNERVGPLYRARLEQALGGRRPLAVELPDGEDHKTLATATVVLDALVAARAGRDATLIALGGGVVGDVAGFAAACYLRGIAWIQCPTTLLAMVDAAVGGKTGVNHPAGKNLIGAFHQPRAVFADLDTLATLTDREYRAGLAEVIKYGAALDAEFLAWLEANLAPLAARDAGTLEQAVSRCCELKAALVAADEREGGARALLNYGHTFGHALETLLGYGRWLHGEAVAAGMVMAARVAAATGRLEPAEVARLVRLIAAAGLPVAPPPFVTRAALAPHLAHDKKRGAGGLRFVLLEGLGRAAVVDDVPDHALDAAFATDPEAARHG